MDGMHQKFQSNHKLIDPFSIDKKELRNWAAKEGGVTSSAYESSTYGRDVKDNTTSQYGRYKYRVSFFHYALESRLEKSTS